MGAAAILLAVVGTLIAGPAPAQAAGPDSPSAVTAVPGRRMIAVSWTLPVNGPANHYTATTSPAGGSCSTVSNSGALTCDISNLSATTSYTVGVIACLSSDELVCSSATVSSSVMTGQPGIPAAPAVVFNGNPNAVTVSWVTPALGAGIDSYVVTAIPSTGLTGTCKTLIPYLTNSCGFAGLVSGTSYTFKVAASGVTNSTGFTGSSAPSPASTAKIAGPPGAPLNVAAVRIDDNGLTLNWSSPTTGAPVGGYTVDSADGGIGPFDVNLGELSGCTTSGCAFTGLDPTRAYTFEVTANGVGAGSGSSSATSAAVFPGAPGAPDAPFVELGTAGRVTVSWTPSVTGGTATGYTVSPGFVAPAVAPTPLSCVFPATSCDFTGLTAGEPYTFTVTATNNAGSATSASSDPIVSSPPAQPGQLAVTLGATAGSATVNWVQPANGGVVNYFTVTPTPFADVPGTACVAGPAAQACSFTGLSTVVPYSFVVTAVGDLGSVASDPTELVLLAVPGAPGAPQVALNSTTAATVTWTPPSGGGAVTSYTVVPIGTGAGSANVPGSCLLAGATTCAITGLTPATSYTFAVTAVNGAGSGLTSTSGAVLTSAPGTPGTPTVVLTTSNSATLTWTASAGGPVTGYTVVPVATAISVPGGCIATTSLSCVVTGLATLGQSYQFKVTATNGAGSTDSGNSISFTAAAPSGTAAPTVVVTSATTATVSWTAPIEGQGPVTSYTLLSTGLAATAPIPGSCVTTVLLTCAVTGLTPGATYEFTTRAINVAGFTESLPSIAATTSAPGAPVNLTATVTSTTAATLTWTAPATGAPPTSYAVAVSVGGAFDPVPGSCLLPAAVSCALTGLTPGGSYTFAVTATNGAGLGTAATLVGVGMAVPNAPATPTVVVDSATAATVNWTAPVGGGPVADYTVSANGLTPGTVPGTCLLAGAVSCSITNLTSGGSYTFTVIANNLIGPGSPAISATVSLTVPGAPTALKVVVDSTTAATVSWTAPTGGPVTSYTVVANGMSPGIVPGSCLLAVAVSCSITGLLPGDPYSFTVTPSNGAGVGTPATSAWWPLTVSGAPGQPTAVVNSGTQVTLSWTAPVSGGPVTYYDVVSSGTMDTATIPGSCLTTVLLTCVVTGLTPGGDYQFLVTAHNGVGYTDSPISSNVVTGAPGTPGTPTVVLTAPSTATVSWTAPSGGPVVSYALVATGTGLGLGTAMVSCSTPTSLSCSISNLFAGETYTFVVTATNALSSTPSSSSTPVLIAAPGVPTLLRVAVDSTTAATVSWTAPTTGGPVASYTVVPTGTGAGSATIPPGCLLANAVSCAITGLTAGASYTFAVTAVNGVNAGTTATTASVPIAAPDAPTSLYGVVNSLTSVTFHWTPPTTGGPADSYIYYPLYLGLIGATPSADCTTPGTTSCTYTNVGMMPPVAIGVSASNGAGSSVQAVSDPVYLLPPSAPGTPTAVVTSSTTATLSWGASAPVGTVSDYTVVSNGTDTATIPGSCVTTRALSCLLTGLTAGQSYKFKVTANNGISSVDSADSAVLVISPPGAPGVPTIQVLSASSVQVTWTAASGPVTGYTVTGYTVADPGDLYTSPACVNITALTCVFLGLSTTESYTFLVTALGLGGDTPSIARSTAINTAPPGIGLVPTVALAGPNAVRVSWLAPSGGAVTGYTVTSNPVLTAPAGCTNVLTLTCVFDHLASGTSYTFQVGATGATGATVPSLPSAAIIPGPPDAPVKPTVAQTGSGTGLMVTWIAPAEGAGIAGYTVESNPAGFGCEPLGRLPDPTSCLVTGLTLGLSYSFRVQARGVGNSGDSAFSPFSDAIVVGLPGTPGAPTEPVAVVTGLGQISVTWGAPIVGGPVTSYTVATQQWMPSSASGCAETLVVAPCVFTGLNPGTAYTFQVTAHGPQGTALSADTDPLRPTRPNKPGTPTVVLSVVDTTTIATVSWTAPIGGGPVTSYLVTVTPELTEAPIPTPTQTPLARNGVAEPCGGDLTNLSCVFVGLDSETTYTFHVEAVGPAGFSAQASDSAPVRLTAPAATGMPTVAVTGPGTVQVSWDASTGGGPVSSYTVTSLPGITSPCIEITALTCDFTGLSPTTSYTFVVTANGPAGPAASPPSASISPAVPGVPGTPTATVLSPTTARIIWSTPPGGVLLTGYTVTTDPVVTPTGDCLSTLAFTCVFEGLTPGTSYTFLVTANGVAGSTPSAARSTSVSTAAAGMPGTPTVTTTVAGTVHVVWTAPASGAGPVTGYTVTSDPVVSPPSGCENTTNLSCDFTGLGSASHTFLVTAVGPGGNTASAGSSPGIVAAIPAAPLAPTVALGGANAVQVSWVAQQGGPVTGYTVVSTPGATAPLGCTNTTNVTCLFTGLTSGTSYTFKVSAAGPVGGPSLSLSSGPIVAGPPNAPAKPTVVAGSATSATVSWVAPSGNAGIIGYTVQSNPGNMDCAVAAGPSATSCSVTGLTAGTPYTFQVRANGTVGGGDSTFSPASTSITPGALSAPTGVGVVAGNGLLTVSWTALDSSTGLLNYQATASPGSGVCTTLVNTATSCVISGLTNGTSYTVTVVALGTASGTNSVPSAASASAKPTAGAPGRPTAVQAVAVVGGATISWSAPSSTGDGIANYIASAVGPTTLTCSTSALTCPISGLTNGVEYTVSVVAVGLFGSGTSAASTPTVTVRPVGAPGAPTNVTATSGTLSLTVGFTPGSVGAGISSYTATASPGGLTCNTPYGTNTCVITGLTAGTFYTVTVVANGVGSVGNSPASQASPSVMVETFPPPTLPSAAPTGTAIFGPVTSSAGATLGPNATTTITGATYAPFTGITVGIYPGPVVLGTATTDSTGAFTLSVTLPGVSLGAHTIVAAGLRSTGIVRYRSSPVTVSAGLMARNAVSGSAGPVAHRLPASRLPSRVLVSRADR